MNVFGFVSSENADANTSHVFGMHIHATAGKYSFDVGQRDGGARIKFCKILRGAAERADPQQWYRTLS